MYFVHPLFGEDSHLDEYVSDGLVQPPTGMSVLTMAFADSPGG